MSGIAGIIRFDGGPAECSRVEAMTAAMAHRGPDGIAHWSGGPAALGHLMLHTTPESLHERQPLVSADGRRVLVMHGRIDNRDELGRALSHRRVRPLDDSDAAMMLAAYEAWGDDCPERVEGDFALVIWDAARQAAFCARDRIGMKPFVWHWDGRRFSFASDVAPILELPWVEEEVDEATVAQFLAFDFRSAESTFWRGVNRLAPGHRMIVDGGGARSEYYWRLDFGRRLGYRREEEYGEAYREILFDVVRRMSRSHRPLALQASGGLDSSAVLAVADRLERQGRLLAPGALGYTLGFADEGLTNDLPYARELAAFLERPIHEIEPTDTPLEWYLTEGRRTRDFPGYPNGLMGDGLIDAAAGAGSRVLIGGDGGDYVLGASAEDYLETVLRGEWTGLLASLAADLRDFGMAGLAGTAIRRGVLPLLNERQRLLLHRLRRGFRDARGDWLTPRLTAALASSRSSPDPADRLLFRTQRSGQRALFCAQSAHSKEAHEHLLAGRLERREPFLNARLISFMAAVPEHLLRRGKTDKHLHRTALRCDLPPGIIGRRDKAVFATVFRPPLRKFAALMRSGALTVPPEWVRADIVPAVLEQAESDRARPFLRAWQVWSLMGCMSVTGTGLGGLRLDDSLC